MFWTPHALPRPGLMLLAMDISHCLEPEARQARRVDLALPTCLTLVIRVQFLVHTRALVCHSWVHQGHGAPICLSPVTALAFTSPV